jgi:hypothetical protein
MPRYNNGGKTGPLNARVLSTGTNGIWGLDELKRSFNGPPDPSFSSVVLLARFQPQDWIHANVAASSGAAIRDYSGHNNHVKPNCFSFTSAGVASGISPFISQFGFTHSATCSLNTGCYGWVANGTLADFAYGVADFTIELWIYFVPTLATANLIDQRTGTAAQITPTLYTSAAGTTTLHYFTNGADRIVGATAVTTNAWHHIALSRVAGSTYLYLDGVQQGATYVDANNYVAASGMVFGGPLIATTSTPHFVQEIRVTKGVGRYSGATCTVPTGPFPTYGP